MISAEENSRPSPNHSVSVSSSSTRVSESSLSSSQPRPSGSVSTSQSTASTQVDQISGMILESLHSEVRVQDDVQTYGAKTHDVQSHSSSQFIIPSPQ